jgi:hypothetical protein
VPLLTQSKVVQPKYITHRLALRQLSLKEITLDEIFNTLLIYNVGDQQRKTTEGRLLGVLQL